MPLLGYSFRQHHRALYKSDIPLGFLQPATFFIFSALFFPEPSIAVEDSGKAPLYAQDYGTGDWGGYRSELREKGFTFNLNLTTDPLGNPVGGMKQSAANAAGLTGGIYVDLERLAGFNGLSFGVSSKWSEGRNLSQEDIGNLFAVAEILSDDGWRLADVYFEQNLFNEAVNVALGQLTTGNDFATSQYYTLYVSRAVHINPTGLWTNIPSFTAVPLSQWGVRVSVEPTPDWYWRVGAYNADPQVQDPDNYGLDFRFNPEDGVLILSEVALLRSSDGYITGLPGRYVLGGYYDTSDYEYVTNLNRHKEGNGGFYITLEQTVFEEQQGQGLSLWSTFIVGLDNTINTVPFSAYGGASYKGLFPGRDDDITAVAAYLANFSTDLIDQDFELVWEAMHRFQVTPWFYASLDLQYISNPSGREDIPDALVFGAEFSIEF
ncbi:carbohydrate porin [Flexibacterium corallicola]|uniref:carbohydrate porin n=1 Tax=Flexibacterium corallicola TaxID=3037259 RepID=UPI00286F86D7|nr:carbohydrate porin [Pseudovibrio sp. M1P-2-3]